MNIWKPKLLAYLHDPPEKAYDYSPEHGRRAQFYAGRVGLDLAEWEEKSADHTAAAADRFVFPGTKRREGNRWVETGVPALGGGLRFIHPLSGMPVNPRFPTEDEALGFCRDGFPDFAEVADDSLRFWLIWRLWRQYTLEQPAARPYALGLGCLPGDTRIPDATIWHHDAVVSALEAARDAQGRFAPAFLLFQLGPVQEFIAQARSTRDLWSGSYLLSWMMAHVMKRIADRLGPDVIIYPSLRGQPIFDWLEQARLRRAFHTAPDGTRSKDFWTDAGCGDRAGQELALTPTLPNRFLAVVPADFDPSHLADVLNPTRPDSEWGRIAGACWGFLSATPLPEGAKALWDAQVARFWQPTWQLWPWQDVKRALDLLDTIPAGKQSRLHLARAVALAIPELQKDARCYAHGLEEIESAGWAWSANYQLLQHRLDARRQTRDFDAWPAGPPAHKDHFSGKEEVVATSGWIQAARQQDRLRHLFRNDDELGAVNLIKRVWHKAYLERLESFHPQIESLRRARESFDSVPAVAASPFAHWLQKQTASGPLREPGLGFMQAASNAREDFPEAVARWESDEQTWFRSTDASVWHLNTWDRAIEDADSAEARRRLSTARAALVRLLDQCRSQPSTYYAVLALDGDEMGRWLSGEKTPAVREVLTDKAARWFADNIKDAQVAEWLDSHRPLSPGYHLQFSEALANFGLYCARRIVEAHHGQLVYSGGDDVLAMLPADEAVACAQGLRLAFQGRSAELARHAGGRYAPFFDGGVPQGFVQLKDGDGNPGCRRHVEPSWPLLVPGPRATVSVGLAIGHIKEPLQDMIREAQAAEKRAKGSLGRNALAVTLFKRSGETVEWGCRFSAADDADSAGLQLLAFLQSGDRYRHPLGRPDIQPPISGKFPYRVAELLRRYQDHEVADGLPDYTRPVPLGAAVRQIAEREFAWVVSQQCEKLRAEDRAELLRLAGAYLHEIEHRREPLHSFIQLFAIEAFIARTAE